MAKLISGKNDLQTRFPDVAKEWNLEKNEGTLPEQVMPGSNKKAWWKCSKGHEWMASISNRTSKHPTGCPYCANKIAIAGINDLKTVYPEIASEWNREKNAPLSPTEVTAGCNKQVWWMCSKGHEWQAKISNRTGTNTSGCPYCTGQKILPGFNDLQTRYPDVAMEWNYEKNGELLPSQLMPGSGRKVWWKCASGHEWQASLNSRTGYHPTGCPYCTGKVLRSGINDLQTLFPDISAEWNQEKNGDFKPSQVMAYSNQKVWWKCSEGHEWQTIVASRTRKNKTGCPYCAGKKALSGKNDLETLFPAIAAEWNHEKNGNLLPSQVLSGSNKKVWWKCKKGHTWKTVIYSRTGKSKTGCPYCAGRKAEKQM